MIEDYFLADDTELCPEDQQRLKDDVSVPTGVPLTEKRLRALLEDNGLVVEEFEDMTDRWSVFIWERCVGLWPRNRRAGGRGGGDVLERPCTVGGAPAPSPSWNPILPFQCLRLIAKVHAVWSEGHVACFISTYMYCTWPWGLQLPAKGSCLGGRANLCLSIVFLGQGILAALQRSGARCSPPMTRHHDQVGTLLCTVVWCSMV